MDRRGRIAMALLTVGILVGLGFVGAVLAPTDTSRRAIQPFRPLHDLIAPELDGGWQIIQQPDIPGPYRRFGLAHQTFSGGGGGARWRSQTSQAGHQFLPRPNGEQLAMCLETTGGRLTVVVLALAHPRPDSTKK